MLKDLFIKDCIIAALAFGKSVYSYLYIPYFAFNYTCGNEDIGEGILNRWDTDNEWILNTKELLTIYDLDKDNINEIKEILENENSLIVWSDVYSCPWNMFYKKKHIKHVYVIEDMIDGYFVCNDEFFGVSKYKYEIFEACKNMDSLHFAKVTNIDMSLSFIKKNMYFYLIKFGNPDEILQRYKRLADDLINLDINKQHVENNNYYGNTILRKLKNLSRYRYGYAEFLKNLGKSYSLNLNYIVHIFEKLGELWVQLMMILLRIFIRNKGINIREKNIITNTVNNIAMLEKTGLDELLLFVKE